jgi:hypothetical protein
MCRKVRQQQENTMSWTELRTGMSTQIDRNKFSRRFRNHFSIRLCQNEAAIKAIIDTAWEGP